MNGSIPMTSAYAVWKGRMDWLLDGGNLTVTMYTWMTDGHGATVKDPADIHCFGVYLTINGVTKVFSYEYQNPSEIKVGTLTVAVSGETAEISGRVNPGYGSRMYNNPLTGAETVSFVPEPEAQPSVVTVSKNSVRMGSTITISMENENPDVTHKLSYSFGSKSGSIADAAGNSSSWTVPDLAAACSNSLSGSCTITCETMIGDKSFGTTKCVLTLKVPEATAVSAGSGTIGTSMTVSISPQSGNFRHTITCEVASTTVQIASSAAKSVKWTPPYDLAKAAPTLKSITATIRCVTKNGTAKVGETTKSIKLTVPENDTTKPKINSVVLTPITSLTGDLAGLYIRGRSGIRAVTTASGAYADIASYSLDVGGVKASGQTATIPILSSSGEKPVTVTVTDARGFRATWSGSIHVLAYDTPRIIPASGSDQILCDRALVTGELSPGGTYLAIQAAMRYSQITVNGVQKNTCELRYRYMAENGDAFSQWEQLKDGRSVDSGVSVLIGGIVTSTATSYILQLSAIDTISGEDGEHRMVFYIGTDAISFVLYDGVDGAGFGKYPEGPHMVDIAEHMLLLVRGRMKVLGEHWEKLGLAGGVSDGAESLRAGKGFYYRVVSENHVHAAFCVALQMGTGWKAINQEPIPEGYRPAHPVYSLCPFDESGMALVMAGTDGVVSARLLTGSSTAVNTFDGSVDYFI